MPNAIKVNAFNKSFTITWLDIIAFLYFSRVSIINFFAFFHIPTFLVAGAIVVPLYTLLFLYSVKHFRKLPWDAIIMFFAFYVFFAVTLRIHPEYLNRYLDIYNDGRFTAKAVFTFCAPMHAYFIVRLYRNKMEDFYRLFHIMPYVIMIGNIVLIFNRDANYRMDFGYHMAMAGILFIAQYMYEKKTLSLYLSVLCMAAGVLYGSRACIVGYAVFVIVYSFWENKLNPRKFFLLFCGGVVAAVVSSQTLMMKIYLFCKEIGFDSRTLMKLASGNIASDNARQDHLWPILIKLLEKSSFFEMYGAFGDRYYLPPYYPYAHNLFLEVLLTFGKFLGGTMLIVMFLSFFKVLLKDKSYYALLTMAFGCFSLCRLMVSTSFWAEMYFWTFLAMLATSLNHVRLQKKHRTFFAWSSKLPKFLREALERKI